MANLLIEIGNTALKAAWSEETTLGKTFRYQGEKVMDFILSLTSREKPYVLAVISARPLSDSEEEILRKECDKLLVLSSSHPEVLRACFLDPYLTFDRASSLVAARYLFKGKSCTVFDFGTTLTVDFIGEDGSHLGGNISPGCRTRFKALNRYSKNLPLVNTPEDFPPKGVSVVSSIESGVISGIMFEIEGYMARFPSEVTVFTGGDAVYFAKRMKNPIFVVSNLVLIGLSIIAREYGRKDD